MADERQHPTSSSADGTPLGDSSGALRPARRLHAIDAARGLALVGMIVVNVGPIAADSALQRLWLAPYGRASILFVLVAGLSMSLLLKPGSPRGRRMIVIWRAVILLLGGLALSQLPHGVNVILPLYGALFLVALLVHRLPTGVLVGAACVAFVIGPLLYLGETIDHRGDAAPMLLWTGDIGELVHTLVLSRPYPLVVWLVPFLVGMVLGRLDLRSRALQVRMILIGAIAAVAAFAAGEIAPVFTGPIEEGPLLLLTATPHGQMPLWLLTSVGSAVLVVGVLLRLWHRVGGALAVAVSAGQVALTLYVAHLLVLAAVRPDDGFDFPQGVLVSIGLILCCLLAAVLIRRRFTTGPLEWVLRAKWLESRG